LKYLHVLLRRPNEPIDALEVSDIVAGRDPSLRPRSSALTIDKKTKLSLFARLTRRREDLVAALDCGDEEEVRAARSEIRQLEDYLGENLGPGGRLQREPKDQKKARDAVAGAIKEAIEHIAEYDDALARHFKERVSRKAVCQYLGDGVRWVTEQTASSVGNT
jgi:hypothetical protein